MSRNRNRTVLGIKLRGSNDTKEVEKKKKEFTIILSKLSQNAKDLRSLVIPQGLPIAPIFQSLIQAISKNRTIHYIDISQSDINSAQIPELMKALHESNNFALRQINLTFVFLLFFFSICFLIPIYFYLFHRNITLDSSAVKSILEYIRQHLHLVELRFTDPFNDPTAIYSPKDMKVRDKIYISLLSNLKMHKVCVLTLIKIIPN